MLMISLHVFLSWRLPILLFLIQQFHIAFQQAEHGFIVIICCTGDLTLPVLSLLIPMQVNIAKATNPIGSAFSASSTIRSPLIQIKWMKVRLKIIQIVIAKSWCAAPHSWILCFHVLIVCHSFSLKVIIVVGIFVASSSTMSWSMCHCYCSTK